MYFSRLDFQASVLHHQTFDAITTSARLEDDPPDPSTPSQQQGFDFAHQAEVHMALLTRNSMRLVRLADNLRAGESRSLQFLPRQKRDAEDWLNWKSMFQPLLDSFALQTSTVDQTHAVKILRARAIARNILLVRATSGSETGCDSCVAEFQAILALATDLQAAMRHRLSEDILSLSGAPNTRASFNITSQPTFCLQTEMNLPLFLVAWKCREPSLRRKAAELLRVRFVREGLWDSSILAAIAERIIEIEESSTTIVTESRDIPAAARVSSVGILSSDIDHGTVASFIMECQQLQHQERIFLK